MSCRLPSIAFAILAPLANAAPAVDYAKEIRPLFKERCVSCHGSVKQKGKLRLDAGALILKGAENPVVIAGDTNLPGLSPLLAKSYGQYTDGFSVAGRGFGYTFPAKRPWMRIDRVLADPRLRFLRFFTGSVIASDHLYVVAELGRAD